MLEKLKENLKSISMAIIIGLIAWSCGTGQITLFFIFLIIYILYFIIFAFTNYKKEDK